MTGSHGNIRPAATVADAPRGTVGLVSCVAFAVGTMVGAGVFVLSGLAVRRAGPAAFVAFGLAGVMVLLSALSFAVVASLAPAGGSGYAYVGRALGRYWGFVTSWCFYLFGIIAAAFVLEAFGVYLHDFFWAGLPVIVLALFGVCLLTLLNLGPASAVGRAEIFLVAVKVAILVLLIAFAIVHADRARFTPFAPHGASSVVGTSALLFIAYLGFNVVTNMAGDVERPHRTIPLAIVISMGIVAVVYLGVVLALLAGGITTYDEASVGTAARHLMGGWGGILIPIAAIVSTLSAANANVLGSSEIIVRLAGQRDVPVILGRLWHGHPTVSVLAGAAGETLLLVSGQGQSVVALANVAGVVAMGLVNLAALVGQHCREAGGLRLPFGPLLPALGLVAALAQLAFISWLDVLLGLGLIVAGSAVYLLRHRGFHHEHHAAILEHLDRNAGPTGRALARRARKGA